MKIVISIAILAGGIALLAFGLVSSHSACSHISKLLTGSPTGTAMWMMNGGIMATIVGIVCVVRSFVPEKK